MAERLKDHYGTAVVQTIGAMISRVHPGFRRSRFEDLALKGLSRLELMARGKHIAEALRATLPEEIPTALRILTDSFGPTLEEQPNPGMGSFLYLPHSFFIANYGLSSFDLSLKAQRELTQRFTAEFCIRPFLIADATRTLQFLSRQLHHQSPHVRRWISEGTRPRLPWAPRLPAFQRDPTPVLKLLEALKDDSAEYVRRSVANNLNDIWKDNPAEVYETIRRWKPNSTPERRWIANRALRNAIKTRDEEALKLLGIRASKDLKVSAPQVKVQRIGTRKVVRISFTVTNEGSRPSGEVIADFQIHYVKKNGSSSPKVFKLSTIELAPGEGRLLSKQIGLEDMTTRRHHAGKHLVDAIVNGSVTELGAFQI